MKNSKWTTVDFIKNFNWSMIVIPVIVVMFVVGLSFFIVYVVEADKKMMAQVKHPPLKMTTTAKDTLIPPWYPKIPGEIMKLRKNKPNTPKKKIAEIWVTEKGNPVIRNLGKVENADLVQVLGRLRDSLMAEVIIKKFLDEKDSRIVDPVTGMPTLSDRGN